MAPHLARLGEADQQLQMCWLHSAIVSKLTSSLRKMVLPDTKKKQASPRQMPVFAQRNVHSVDGGQAGLATGAVVAGAAVADLAVAPG